MGNGSRFPAWLAATLSRGTARPIGLCTTAVCCHLIMLLTHLVPVHQVAAQETEQKPREQPTEEVQDSDGDGLPDATDEHPLIAEIQEISWRVTPLKLGWKLDSSIDLESLELTETERSLMKQTTFSFGTGGNGNASLSTSSIGAGLSVAGKVSWDRDSQSKATDLKRLVENRKISQHLTELNLEFTVEFFNHSGIDYLGQNLQIPIKADGAVVTIAQPMDANGPVPVIRLPAKRNRATPILFRAALDTTQSLDLLATMEKSSPEITIQETQGHIVSANPEDPKDAIAYLTGIDESTWTITVELDGAESEWRVARQNPKTKAPTTFADAFEAINSLTLEYSGWAEPEAVPFEFKPDYVRSIYGRKNSLLPFGWWVTSRTGTGGSEEDIDPKVSLVGNARVQFNRPTRSEYGSPRNSSPEESLRFAKRWKELAEISDDPFPKFVGGAFLIDSDPKQALEFIQFAAGKGEAEAMFALGAAHLNGKFELEQDVEKARSLLTEAADKGISAAFVLLGKMESDAEAAVEFVRKAAALGDPEGLFLIGNIHANGLGGVPKNEKKAVEFWMASAELRHADAFDALGWAFHDGNGVPADLRRAIEYWRQGHESGNTNSTYMLANSYESGAGDLDADKEKALDLYRSAADRGNGWALLKISHAYRTGFGGLKIDETKSLELLRKAAEQGIASAMTELADAYAEGDLGLGVDEKSAAHWYKKAQSSGSSLSWSAEKLIKRQDGGN